MKRSIWKKLGLCAVAALLSAPVIADGIRYHLGGHDVHFGAYNHPPEHRIGELEHAVDRLYWHLGHVPVPVVYPRVTNELFQCEMMFGGMPFVARASTDEFARIEVRRACIRNFSFRCNDVPVDCRMIN